MRTEFERGLYYKSTDGEEVVYIANFSLLEIVFVPEKDVVIDVLTNSEDEYQPDAKTAMLKTFMGRECYEYFESGGKTYKATDLLTFEESIALQARQEGYDGE